MMHFTVHAFNVNRITGFADVDMSWSLGTSTTNEKGTYSSESLAASELYKMKKSWILHCLDRYIVHKKTIIEASDKYRTQKVMGSLSKCLDFTRWANGLTGASPSLQEICKFALRIRDHLETILPAESNPSYNSSRDNLTALMVFCKENGPTQEKKAS